MSNPQQPELARSRKTPTQDPDAAASVIEGQRRPGDEGRVGQVPPENQPGHHPEREQDKPDLDAFAAKLGATRPEDRPPPEGDARSVDFAPDEPPNRVAVMVAAPAAIVLGLLIRRRRRRSRATPRNRRAARRR